jgi:uncharacterized protein (TIGR03437 family)
MAAVNAVTGAYVGKPGLLSGVDFAPARPGRVLTLFLTGIGETNPVIEPGVLPAGAASPVAPIQLTVGGSPLASKKVLYVGTTPGNAGLCQLNIQLPENVPAGDLEVTITVGGHASPAKAYTT